MQAVIRLSCYAMIDKTLFNECSNLEGKIRTTIYGSLTTKQEPLLALLLLLFLSLPLITQHFSQLYERMSHRAVC